MIKTNPQHSARPSTSKAPSNESSSSSSSSSSSTSSSSDSSADESTHNPVNKVKKPYKTPVRRAFCKHALEYTIKNSNPDIVDPVIFFQHELNRIKRIITRQLARKGSIRFSLLLNCSMERENDDEVLTPTNFKTELTPLYSDIYLNDTLEEMFEKILLEIVEMEGKGSGWSLVNIKDLVLKICKYTPLSASSHVDLPTSINNKKCVINVQNYDNLCFLYSVLVPYVNKKHRPSRVVSYTHLLAKINYKNLPMPMPVSAISQFEKLNPSYSINVFVIDEESQDNEIRPLRVVQAEKENHRDLLLVRDQYSGNSHYCYIRNLERLIRAQVRPPSCHRKFHLCKRCFSIFIVNGEERLKNHKRLCYQNRTTEVKLPKREGGVIPTMSFNAHHKKYKVPFTIYADCETFVGKTKNEEPSEIQNSFTHKESYHSIMSIACYVHTHLDPSYCGNIKLGYHLFEGKKCMKKFVQFVENVALDFSDLYVQSKTNCMKPLTPEQKSDIKRQTICHICENSFKDEDDIVHDHDHLTSEYRGLAHNACNLSYKIPQHIPIFFHNLTGYDSHFLVRELGCTRFKSEVQVIAQSGEKYISFSKKYLMQKQKKHRWEQNEYIELRFLDSFRFLGQSLDSLVNILPKDELHITKQEFNDKAMHLVSRKGVYPYEYTDCPEKLNDTSLPPKEAFFSTLSQKHISDEDYEHAKLVWEKFGIKSLGEYSNLYLKQDVCLLGDIFERFRTLCFKHFQIDPCNYYTTPGMAFDASLKVTRVKLDLITDIDKMLFIESGIRGGSTQCVLRHCKANHEDCPDFDPSLPYIYILYIDANNLYGWAMIQYLPTGEFKWLKLKCFTTEYILNLADDAPYGYFLEVDLLYPSHLHDKHNDLPFCPEMKPPEGNKLNKLLTTLSEKKRYVIHYRMLKLALLHGLILDKVHRVLRFRQEPWLKKFVDLCTNIRKGATNDFEIAFPKLCVNSTYGKSLERIRDRKQFTLVYTMKDFLKKLHKHNFKDYHIYSKNCVGMEFTRQTVILNRPVYLGLAILELSKYLMYEFYYDVLKSFYGKDVELIYTDTDSLILKIRTRSIQKDLKQLEYFFDFSNYPKGTGSLHNTVNNKVLGKFKDEAAGKTILEFVGLRPKCYALRIKVKDGVEDKLTCKGVKSVNLNRTILFDHYKNTLLEQKKMYSSFYTIRSYQHNVYTIKQNKLALSYFDDKRHILPDNVHTLAYGHYKLPVKKCTSDKKGDGETVCDVGVLTVTDAVIDTDTVQPVPELMKSKSDFKKQASITDFFYSHKKS